MAKVSYAIEKSGLSVCVDFTEAEALEYGIKCGGPGSGVPGPCPQNKPEIQSERPSAKPHYVDQLPVPPKVSKPGTSGYAQFYQELQGKYDAIHEAAKQGDTAKVEAVKVKPNSKDSDTQKLHQFKVDTLAVMRQDKPAEVIQNLIQQTQVQSAPQTPPVSSFNLELAKQKYEGFRKEYEEATAEKHKSTVTKNMTPDQWAQMAVPYKVAFQKGQAAAYNATTERMAAEAAHPEEYRKARNEVLAKEQEWDKKEHEFITKLVNEGVRPTASFNDFSVHQMKPEADWEIRHTKDSYLGLTDTHIAEAKALWLEKPGSYGDHPRREETISDLVRISKAYAGEDPVAKEYPPSGMGEVSPFIPRKVQRSGANPETSAFMGMAEVAVQMKPKALEYLAANKAGEIKNGFQSGSKRFIGVGNRDYLNQRRDAEDKIFGISFNAEGDKRPVYGYLEHPDRLSSTGAAIGGNYGSVQIVLKSEVKARTSYTVGDSLDDGSKFHGWKAGAVSDPAPNNTHTVPFPGSPPGGYPIHIQAGRTSGEWTRIATDPEYRDSDVPQRVRYLEAQIHGGLKLSDVKEIRIPRYTKFEDAKTVAKLVKKGVNVVEVQPPHTEIWHANKAWDEAFDSVDG